MKKQLVKHMLHSTAALILCAAMLTGLPFTGTSAPGGNGDGNKPSITADNPDTEENGDSGEDSGIAPMNDLPPKLDAIY